MNIARAHRGSTRVWGEIIPKVSLYTYLHNLHNLQPCIDVLQMLQQASTHTDE